MSSKDFWGGLLLGAAAGAVGALFFSSERGRDAVERVGNRVRTAARNTRDGLEDRI